MRKGEGGGGEGGGEGEGEEEGSIFPPHEEWKHRVLASVQSMVPWFSVV
jgi:hypothetical protein